LTYLLIILVIAIALAPLSHFVPSKRQREVARMREYAAVNGLFVEFRGVPGADRVRSRRKYWRPALMRGVAGSTGAKQGELKI
jgi:hypothetical protein